MVQTVKMKHELAAQRKKIADENPIICRPPPIPGWAKGFRIWLDHNGARWRRVRGLPFCCANCASQDIRWHSVRAKNFQTQPS
jgi:hypothetical protein